MNNPGHGYTLTDEYGRVVADVTGYKSELAAKRAAMKEQRRLQAMTMAHGPMDDDTARDWGKSRDIREERAMSNDDLLAALMA